MSSATPYVSVVMPVWNKSAETFEICLRALASLKRYTREYTYELIVFDNASPYHAESGDARQRFTTAVYDHPGAKLITFGENVGFAKAVNRAAALATGDYLCQMNSDVELVEDSIGILINAMVNLVFDVAMPEHYENCQLYKLGKTAELMGRDWRFGAFWVMPRSLFTIVGGFDEVYEMCYWEDTDLWRRIESAGFTIHGYRGTWVKHVGGASTHPRRDEFFERNRRRFEMKWGKTG